MTIDDTQIPWQDIRHIELKQEEKWSHLSTFATMGKISNRMPQSHKQEEIQLIKDEFYQEFPTDND